MSSTWWAAGGRERSGRPSGRRGALARRLDPIEVDSAATTVEAVEALAKGVTLPNVEHRTTKQREWRAWVGTRDEIERIEALASKLINSRRETLISHYTNLLSVQDLDEAHRREIERRVEQCRTEIALVATAVHRTDIASGDPSEVLREVDRRTVNQYALSAEFPYLPDIRRDVFEIKFTLRKHSYIDPGILLKVESSDLGWANQAFSMLSDEVEKGTPRWSMHTTLARVSTALFTYVAFWMSAWLILSPHLDSKAIGALMFPLSLSIGIVTILPIASDSFYNRIFPPVEMKGEDYQSTTGRRVLFFGSIVLSIIVGVFVNIIS